MRQAFLATDKLHDIRAAIDLAYERTGRKVTRLRVSSDTANDIFEREIGPRGYYIPKPSVAHSISDIFGVPLFRDESMPRGVVEVTWSTP